MDESQRIFVELILGFTSLPIFYFSSTNKFIVILILGIAGAVIGLIAKVFILTMLFHGFMPSINLNFIMFALGQSLFFLFLGKIFKRKQLH